MIVAFDASILIYIIDEQANAPVDPATRQPVEGCRARVMHLLEILQRQDAKIIIPTPALAEVLVRAAKGGPEFLQILGSNKHFRIVGFDQRAAVEFAARQAERIGGGRRALATTRAKAKFDEQIVAIAAVENAATIYSDDQDIAKLADGRFEVTKIAAIPLPPKAAQGILPLDSDQRDRPKP